MKIAFVSREYPPSARAGGIASYVWETARALVREGHVAYVIAASDDIRAEGASIEDGVNVIRLAGGDFFLPQRFIFLGKVISRVRGIAFFFSYRKKVAKTLNELISSGKVECVEFAEYGNEMAMWFRGKPLVPSVVRLHGSTNLDRASGGAVRASTHPLRWLFGKCELRAAELATAISSPSRAMQDFFVVQCEHRRRDVEVIPNSICAEDWAPAKEGGGGGEDGLIRVFAAGSIVKEKGFGELVKACELLRARGMKIRLCLAGKKGRFGNRLARRSADERFREWFVVLGEVDRGELKKHFREADVVVFPSWWEPFGLVCIEAMAAGAVVLGSSCGGMAEIIADGADGFLVDPRDPHNLADKISLVGSMSAAATARMRVAAARKVREQFDSKVVLTKQVALYERVIKQGVAG